MKRLILFLTVAAIVGCNDCIIGQLPELYLMAGPECTAVMPDIRAQVNASDNCGDVTLTQDPQPGTTLSGGHHQGVITATDLAGNQTQEMFDIYLLDTVPPIIWMNDTLIGFNYIKPESTTLPERRAQEVVVDKTGYLTAIRMSHDAGPGTHGIFAVYSDQDGRPAERIAWTDVVDVSGQYGFERWEIQDPPLVVEGQTVHLSWLYEDNPGIHTEEGSGIVQRSRADGTTWVDGMPEEFGPVSQSNYEYSIYAEIQPTSLGPYGRDTVGAMAYIVFDWLSKDIAGFRNLFNWYQIDGGDDIGNLYLQIPTQF